MAGETTDATPTPPDTAVEEAANAPENTSEGEDTPEESPDAALKAFEEERKKIRLDDQCFLIKNMSGILNKSEVPPLGNLFVSQEVSHRKDLIYKHIHKVATKDPGLMMNKLRMTKGTDEFLDIRPWQYSQLTPTIRLYKQYYENENSEPREVEFKFGNFVDPVNDLQEMLDSTLQRGVGIGIERFSYKFRGVNPATAKRDIEANLVIYAQNFNELFKYRPGIDERGKPFTYRVIDLVLLEPKYRFLEEGNNRKQREFNPHFYEIRAVAGWAATGGGGLISSEMWNAIRETQLSMFLTAINHRFNFKEDGSVRLDVTFTARVESMMLDNRSDVLSDPETRRNRIERKKKVEEVLKKASKAKTDKESACEDAEIEKLKIAYRDRVERERENSYLSLLKELTKENLIYTAVLNSEEIKEAVTATAGVASGDPGEAVLTALMQAQSDLAPATAGVAVEEDSSFIPFKVFRPLCSDEEITPPTVGAAVNFDDYTKILPHGSRYISYFFLGDLLALAIQHVLDNKEDIQASLNYGNIKFILGPAVFDEPAGIYRAGKLGVNLADIPISVELFNAFMYEKVVSKKRNSYPLLNFIRDIIKDLIFEALAPDCMGEDKITLMLDTAQISVDSGPPGKKDQPESGKDKGTGREGSVKGSDPFLAKMEQGETALDLDDFKANLADSSKSRFVFDSFNKKSLSESYSYFVIYVFNKGVSSLDFDASKEKGTRYSRDFNNGIPWLATSTDRGLVTSMQFSATTQKFLREARYTERDFSPELQLSNVYNVNVKMLGNNLFFPGQRVYINPSGLGSDELGNPGDVGTNSNIMGLGGYHIVRFVNSAIDARGFSTTLECLFETSGDGIGAEKTDKAIVGEKVLVSCEDLVGEVKSLTSELAGGG
jgi:hypothetical protein